MKILFRLLPAVLQLFAATGCVQLATIDATAEAKYRDVIGREYALRKDFLACGSKPDYPDPGFDHIFIMPRPGIGGRYIVKLGTIPAGTRFRIVGVIHRRSDLFKKPEYAVALQDFQLPQAEGKPIRLYNVAAWPLYEKPADANTAPQLSERYVSALENPSR